MEWKKAQNYTIIFLIAINLLFFCLNIVKAGETRLSTKDVELLTRVLSQRGIALSCRLPKDYRPMPQLYMKHYEYDNIELQEIFFGSITGVSRSQRGNALVFATNKGSLCVEGDRVTFQTETGEAVNSPEQAIQLADTYVREMNSCFSDYSLVISGKQQGSYCLEYGERFGGKQILSNSLTCTIDEKGGLYMAFSYMQPVDYRGMGDSIISAAEAVYAATAAPGIEPGANVDRVDKGYFLTDRRSTGELAAVPYYKVYINSTAYYVNGYSGDVLAG